MKWSSLLTEVGLEVTVTAMKEYFAEYGKRNFENV